MVTACSTGAHAIGDAARLIQLDDADVMVAGGAEAAICRLGIAGFAAGARAVDRLQRHAGAGLAALGQGPRRLRHGRGRRRRRARGYEHAKKRGAKIYAEIIGYGLSGDAYHITAPSEDGDGALRAMQAALKRAKLKPDDIDYINAHGTSTPLGDEIELGAVKRLFGDAAYKLSMSSTKSAIGHLLGAAGAVEAIFSHPGHPRQVVPPTLNLDNPSRRLRHRPGAQAGQGAQGPCCAVEFVRLRRHQRQPDLHRPRLSAACAAGASSVDRCCCVVLAVAAAGGVPASAAMSVSRSPGPLARADARS